MTHAPPLHTFAKILLSASTLIVIHGLLVRAYVCVGCVFSEYTQSSACVRGLGCAMQSWAPVDRRYHAFQRPAPFVIDPTPYPMKASVEPFFRDIMNTELTHSCHHLSICVPAAGRGSGVPEDNKRKRVKEGSPHLNQGFQRNVRGTCIPGTARGAQARTELGRSLQDYGWCVCAYMCVCVCVYVCAWANV